MKNVISLFYFFHKNIKVDFGFSCKEQCVAESAYCQLGFNYSIVHCHKYLETLDYECQPSPLFKFL